MKRWKLYFAYAHLPPHLQTVSLIFHNLANVVYNGYHTHESSAFRTANYALMGLAPFDIEEFDLALDKLRQADKIRLGAATRGKALRLIIEAKDCAVRAHIPDPPEPDAG